MEWSVKVMRWLLCSIVCTCKLLRQLVGVGMGDCNVMERLGLQI